MDIPIEIRLCGDDGTEPVVDGEDGVASVRLVLVVHEADDLLPEQVERVVGLQMEPSVQVGQDARGHVCPVI